MQLYNAVDTHDFSEDVCFLCGTRLADDNRSIEHVFPKWVLRKFNLWNKKITLLNGTQLPYKRLVIPCCKSCNNGPLSSLETRMEKHHRGGFENMQKAKQIDLFLWSMKLIFGLLYREIFLPIDRKDQNSGPILPPAAMEHYKILHYILQAIRIPMQFNSIDNSIPGTVFIFKIKESPDQNALFNFKDDIINVNLLIQLGSIGILAAFDLGAQEIEGRDFFGNFQKYNLHPMQFLELGANFFMKSKLLTRRPKFIFSETETHINVTCLPIAGLSLLPIFSEWNRDEFGKMLSEFTQIPLATLRPTPELTMSCLTDNTGKFIDINFPD